MSNKKNSVGMVVSDYFRKIGLPEPMKPDTFWKKLEKKHGQTARDFGIAVGQRESGLMNIDPYALKNATESLSLDVTGQYESKLYRDFVEWLVNENPERSSSILDLGCGNGVLTCLIAALFPAAKIVAVDINAQGIEIARSLASRLQLSNVEFFVGDVAVIQENLPGRQFDLVIAVKTVHELINKPDLATITGHSISAMRAAQPDAHNREVLAGVRSYVGAGGRLICVDRWSSAESFGWWVRNAESAGLRVLLDASFMLKTSESSVQHTFPISVLTSDQTLPNPSDEQLLSFFVYPEMNDLLNKMVPVEGALAEALFVSLGERKTIVSFEATYRDGSGAQSTSLFIAGAISGLYSTWSTGLRHLYLAPAVAISSMLGHFSNTASSLEGACEVIHAEHDCGPLLEQYGIRLAA